MTKPLVIKVEGGEDENERLSLLQEIKVRLKSDHVVYRNLCLDHHLGLLDAIAIKNRILNTPGKVVVDFQQENGVGGTFTEVHKLYQERHGKERNPIT